MTMGATVDPAARGATSATLTGELATAELRGGDVLAERFRIDTLLGIGGFGFVYRAHDLSLDIDVALKLLRPELARRPESFERFRHELLLARQVSSPHVVRIHDIAQHGGRWFISMDFVDGESLEHRLERTVRLPLESVLAIVRGLLEGLAAAHARGVVHRDLKPANILIDADGRALITDFGVARSLGATGLTQSGVLVGTPEYLSPEQARGGKVDARSDLYALGLIVYEMLCGEVPFAGGTPAETVVRRIASAPPSLGRARPDLPRWLHAFADRLLKANPAQRFASATEALHALDTRRVHGPPLSWPRIGVAVLAVAVLAAAMLAWAQWFGQRGTPAPQTVVAVDRIAWLQLRVAGDDADTHALARAIDEQAQAWLRADTNRGTVPRRRVLDALARQTPGLSDAAWRRQLPDIARALAARTLLHGELHRDGKDFVLRLETWSADTPPAAPRLLRDADGAALFATARAALRPARPAAAAAEEPALTAAALRDFGRALLEADAGNAMAASAALATLAHSVPNDALITTDLLQAQTAAHETLAAQATRERARHDFASDAGILARELIARAQLDDDDAAAAVQTLDAALARYPHDAVLRLLQAQALIADGAGARALDALRRVVADDEQDARAWFLLGRTAIQQGDADAAVSNYLVRALVLNRLRGDRAGEAESSNALGVGYERLGQLDAAAAQYTQAAGLREKLGDEAGLAKALRNLAIVQAVQGDAAAADGTLERVRKLLEKNDDRATLADLYNDRGVVAEEHGAWNEALAFYRKALALRQELNLPGPVADSLNNVGFASYSLGDFDNALAFWQQALAGYRQVDDRNGALRIDESIGLLDVARGRFGTARQRLEAALQSAEDHQLPEEAAVAHTYLAQLALFEGRSADAGEAAAHAAEIFARRADQRGQAEVALLQADVALALGDADAAANTLAPLKIDKLGAEQRGLLLLAQARRARLAGDEAEAARKRADAAAASAPHSSVGVRVQIEEIRAALARGDLAGAQHRLRTLRAESARLVEIPVRLQWLELEVAAALRSGQAADAAARYREAAAALRNVGRWADAVLLHRLGARALAATPGEAKVATDAETASQTQLFAAAPAAARPRLTQLIERRWREESGNGDG